MPGIDEILRALNVMIGLAVIVIMVRRLPEFVALDTEARLERMALGFMVVTAVYGSAEALLQGAQPGVRIVLVFGSLLFVVGSMVTHILNRRRLRRERAANLVRCGEYDCDDEQEDAV